MSLRLPVSLYRLQARLRCGRSRRRERSREMTRYLISFPSGAMAHIPAEEFPAVGEAAHPAPFLHLVWVVARE